MTEIYDTSNAIEWTADDDLKRSLTIDLERYRIESIKLERTYLTAQLEGAKMAKKTLFLEFGQKEPEAFEQLIAPTFDKDIRRAEEALRDHVEKYPSL